MLRKFLIPAAIGFSAYFLYEKYLARQNKEMLYERVRRKLCKKRHEDSLPEENQMQIPPVVNNPAVEDVVKHESKPKETESNALEEPSSIIEQNRTTQDMFDFGRK